MPRNWPSAMITLLTSEPTELVWADLYTITMPNGSIFRFTNHEQDVTLGTIWRHTGVSPAGARNNVRSKLTFAKGVEASEMELDISDDGSTLINGLPILKALAMKFFDGATIQLDMAVMEPGRSWLGPGPYFYGGGSPIEECGRTHAKITVKTKNEELNIQLPRALVQPSCRWTLFDAGCTLVASAFAVNSSLASGSNARVLQSGLTQAGPASPPFSATTLGPV